MAKLPLEGITVIDFATLIAAPGVATFLGDFGATVIKVEQPERGALDCFGINDIDGPTIHSHCKCMSSTLHKLMQRAEGTCFASFHFNRNCEILVLYDKIDL